MSKKVSIIIPIYNAEKYIERVMDSVLNQTYSNLEVVLVDDGSTDNSPFLCDKIAEKDKRVKVFHIQNGGPSKARNKGIEVATGEFVEFVDADDYIEKNCVEKLVQAMKDNDLVVCGYKQKTDVVKEIKLDENKVVDYSKNPAEFFNLVKKNLFNIVWNKLYRKELITKLFDERFFIGEDTIFNTNYIKNCKRVSVICDTLYNYDFSNSQSIIHSKLRSEENYMAYWQALYDFCSSFFEDESYKFFINSNYLKSTMHQAIIVGIRKNLKFKEFKKVFAFYRNNERTIAAFKNYDKHMLENKKLLGRIVTILFKLKFKFLFYLAAKMYKKIKTKEA